MTESPTFALAARSFSQTSETFVRLHAERIAPGRTVFLTYDSAPRPQLPGPVLAGLGGVPRQIDAQGRVSHRAHLPFGWLEAGRSRVAANFLRARGVSVMMAEFGPFGGKLLGAAERAGVRLFVHFHGWDASRVLNDPRVVANYRALWERATGFFAPSRFLADKLIAVGCPADRITVTPCGIDPANFPRSERIAGRCLMVGRLVPKKAPHLAIAAFARVAARHPEARLDVVGDGELMEACRTAAEGLGDRIRLHGALPHDQVRALTAEAEIFLQHSVTTPDGNTEGLPVSILEAMSAGLCVISTRHSGIPEAVIEGESGLLVDEHDVGGMAKALDQALGEPDLARQLGDAAAQRLRAEFTVDHISARQRSVMGLPNEV